MLAYFVNRDAARVVEQRDGLCLVQEPFQFGIASENAGLNHLEGDGPVEADLPGFIHHTDAAATEHLLKLMVAEVANGGAPREAGQIVGTGSGRIGGAGSRRPCLVQTLFFLHRSCADARSSPRNRPARSPVIGPDPR